MRINNETSEVQINILRASNPESEDYWDSNWLDAEIRIKVEGFSGNYGTNLRTDDLQRFYNDFLASTKAAINEIEFTTMEEGLYLHFERQLTGTIVCRGLGNGNSGNSLTFQFSIDLITYENFMHEVKNAMDLFPVVGNEKN